MPRETFCSLQVNTAECVYKWDRNKERFGVYHQEQRLFGVCVNAPSLQGESVQSYSVPCFDTLNQAVVCC